MTKRSRYSRTNQPNKKKIILKATFHKFYLFHSWILWPKFTKDSLWFFRRFYFNNVSFTLSLPRNLVVDIPQCCVCLNKHDVGRLDWMVHPTISRAGRDFHFLFLQNVMANVTRKLHNLCFLLIFRHFSISHASREPENLLKKSFFTVIFLEFY